MAALVQNLIKELGIPRMIFADCCHALEEIHGPHKIFYDESDLAQRTLIDFGMIIMRPNGEMKAIRYHIPVYPEARYQLRAHFKELRRLDCEEECWAATRARDKRDVRELIRSCAINAKLSMKAEENVRISDELDRLVLS
jgi:hypothetical protein